MRIQSRKVNALKSELLCTRSINSIASICTKYLPQLGITGCYLVLHQDNGNRLVGGFDGNGRVGQSDLPETTLLPDVVASALQEGVYVVEPLFMENQSLGYAVLKTDVFSGTLIEELRTSLSSAIKGTMLLDAANKAKEMAEKRKGHAASSSPTSATDCGILWRRSPLCPVAANVGARSKASFPRRIICSICPSVRRARWN